MIRGAVAIATACLLVVMVRGQEAAFESLIAEVNRLPERLKRGENVASRVHRLASRIAEAPSPLADRAELLVRLRGALPTTAGDVIARVALYQALLAHRAGDYEAMLRFAEDASRSSEEALRVAALGSVFNAALFLGNIGKAQAALVQLRASRSAAAKPGSTAIGTIDYQWVELLLRTGRIRAAGKALDELEAAAPDQPQLLVLRLEELLATERFDEALEAARRIAPSLQTATQRSRLSLSSAFALLRSGRVAEGVDLLRPMLGDPTVDAAYVPRIRAELALVELQQGMPLAEVAGSLGDAVSAPLEGLQEWPLVARARYELRRHREAALTQPELVALRDALAAKFEFMLLQWRSTPEVSEGVAFLQWSARRELLACLCLAEVAVGGAAVDRCLQHALAADSCGSMARQLVASPLSATAFRQLAVPPGGVLLWFLPAPHGSVVLIVSQTQSELVELPSDIPLRGWLRELRTAVVDERRLGPSWREPLATLTAPLEAWLFGSGLREVLARYQRVTVLGRELLAGLPMEFLVMPSTDERLGLSHAIDYMPSAAMAREPRTVREDARVGLVGVTEPSPEIAERYPQSAVPDSARILTQVAAPIADETVEVVPDAGIAELRRLVASTDCLLVFAHGRRRHWKDADGGQVGLRPLGIVLRDTFFGGEHLVGLPRAPSVVVLASCGTARAGVDRGEDSQLFGNSWLAAGTDLVLNAEGDLQLAATAELVREFLAGLAADLEPAEALRRARVAVARLPGGEHPALHCALRLDRAGLTRPHLQRSRGGPPRWALLVASMVAVGLLVTGFRAWRRRRTQPPLPSGSPSGGSSSGGGGGITGGSTLAPMPPSGG